jgi:hypothetical protein
MQQTYEYYMVDPNTWRDLKPINNIKTSSISRDSDTETLGSATFDITESVGECYIRVYMVTVQNGVTERRPLGTFLVQTPSSSFNGKIRNVSMDAYTPLLELKEKQPPLGYYIPKGVNIMDQAYELVRDNMRGPVVKPTSDKLLDSDFVADPSDTWLSFVKDLIAKADHTLSLDEMGVTSFAPVQDTASLQPIWTYDDGNSSILYPEVTMDHDLFGIPNVIEVVYSSGAASISVTVRNDDPNSPISTVSRGREIVYRETSPSITIPEGLSVDRKKERLTDYAKQLLRDLSALEYTISYTHGYTPVRIGDCVRLDYTRSGIPEVKAKIISQTIKCEPGCPVSEKAIFTTKLWGVMCDDFIQRSNISIR